jgi:HK97 family phage prohead protease
MFANCYPNTLDTTVHMSEDIDGQPDTFVYTGDIPAMWLRDSGAQVWPYVRYVNYDPQLKRMIAGVINRQFRCIMSQFQTRSEDSGELYISGYFAVFNSNYEIFTGATESIAETAFDGALSDDIRALVNHDSTLVLGRTKAGTLSLKTDTRGLWGEIRINNRDSDALNLYERVKRGDVDQCSFGFDILDEEFEDRGDSVHWTIRRVKLYEVSVVTFPAYEDTSVSARTRQLKTLREKQIDATKSKLRRKLKGEAHYGT